MAFCSSTSDTVTMANYATPMSGTSVLPTNGFSVKSDGTIDSASVRSWVSSLLQREGVVLPNPASSDPVEASKFATQAKALRDKIDAEFCYYYRRYTYALPLLLNQAVSADKATLATNTEYQALKTNVIAINKKLNDIIELFNGITLNGVTTLNGYYQNGDINSLNTQLQTTKDQLKASSRILENADMETEAKKAMIDYTLEKNSASRNMLGLYVFMNLVAGGLLFYIYRST